MASKALPSREMVEGPARAPSRAMLRAAGFDDEALAKPLVAIVHSYSTVTPCNMHLRDLAQHAAKGIRDAGATPIEFNTIVVTDGIAMGTRGVARSLRIPPSLWCGVTRSTRRCLSLVATRQFLPPQWPRLDSICRASSFTADRSCRDISAQGP